MIRYDYCCHVCEITTEVMHSIKDVPKIKCDKCGEQMERQLGVTDYIFVKSGGQFLGDIWDKKGIDFANPNFVKNADAQREKNKQYKLTKEEFKEANKKSIKDTGKPWKPNTKADL